MLHEVDKEAVVDAVQLHCIRRVEDPDEAGQCTRQKVPLPPSNGKDMQQPAKRHVICQWVIWVLWSSRAPVLSALTCRLPSC